MSIHGEARKVVDYIPRVVNSAALCIDYRHIYVASKEGIIMCSPNTDNLSSFITEDDISAMCCQGKRVIFAASHQIKCINIDPLNAESQILAGT